MIYRDDGEIRVERDERGVRTAMLVGGGICLVLAVILVVAAPVRGRELAALVPLAWGVIGCTLIYRNRPQLVIRPDRVGLGRVGKGVRHWTPREEIDHARFFRGMLFEVILYRKDGSIARRMIVSHCNPLELRQAFSEAGIPLE